MSPMGVPKPCPGRGWHLWNLVDKRNGMKTFRCSSCRETYTAEDENIV